MLDKGFAAFITGFFCDLDHFGTNARDFVQAQIMDLVGVQVRCRFLPDAETIIGHAAWLGRNAR